MGSFCRWIVVLAGVACPLAASAQTVCRSVLVAAQALYVRGAFSEVEAVLEPCLRPGELTDDDRVRAYRLLALSALQEGRLVEAKLVALSLLTLRPDYTPDLALDPPSYTDLIGTVKSQLAVERPAPRAAADTLRLRPTPVRPEPIYPLVKGRSGPVQVSGRPGLFRPSSPALSFSSIPLEAPTRRRRPGNVELGYWSGFVSYAGDINRSDVLDNYFTHDGPRFGLEVAYVPASWAVLGFSLEGAYLHKFPVRRATAVQRGIVAETVVGIATVDLRTRAWSEALLSPYLSTGVSLVVTQMQEGNQIAGGPTVGLGLDLALFRGASVFAEASATYPFPNDAFDGSAGPGGDLFSGLRMGLRSQIGR